jgi:hypothetical protein
MSFISLKKFNPSLLNNLSKVSPFLLILIFLTSLVLIAKTYPLNIDLKFKTANYIQCDTLFIQIQVSRDKDFKNLIYQSNWLKCQSTVYFTCEVNVPLIQGSFFWKGRHKDPCTGEVSAWSSPFRFFLLLDSKQLIPGDSNGDSLLRIGDLIYLVNYLFKGGPPPTPLQAGDLNCDNKSSLSDIFYLINFFFKSGPPPCLH